MIIAFNLSAAYDTNPDCYNCYACQDLKSPGYKTEQVRKVLGCRKLDPVAVAANPYQALDGAYSLDHCPGIYVTSPFIGSLWELKVSQEAGIGLLEYFETPLPNPVVESLKLLHSLQNRTSRLRQKQEEEDAKRRGDQ